MPSRSSALFFFVFFHAVFFLQGSPTKDEEPILILSLAKSGTTSMHRFFQCGGYPSVHHRHRRNLLEEWGTRLLQRDLGQLVGKCIQKNGREGKLLLQHCGDYQVWSDLAYTEQEDCFFPIQILEELYQAYPRATWILTTRNSTDWYQSMSTFLGGKPLRKWSRCFGVSNAEGKEFWTSFYDNHTRQIDQFVKAHPSLRYVQVPLNEAAHKLSTVFGIEKSCFGSHRESKQPWNRLIDSLETKVVLWNHKSHEG
jgi:Sulfotransferase domain